MSSPRSVILASSHLISTVKDEAKVACVCGSGAEGHAGEEHHTIVYVEELRTLHNSCREGGRGRERRGGEGRREGEGEREEYIPFTQSPWILRR